MPQSDERAAARKQVVFLASVDWGAAWQRHQAWAAQFAAAGFEVFFVENTGFRDLRAADAGRVLGRLKRAAAPAAGTPPPAGVTVVSPLVLPPTRPPFRRANRGWLVPRLAAKLRRAGLKPGALAMAYLPTDTTLALLDATQPDYVVYDCVDHFEGHPSPPRGLAQTEEALLRRARCVLVTSPFLFMRLASRHSNVHELHHGAGDAFFEAQAPPPDEYRRFLYYGSLWHAIDYRYPAALARAGFSVDLLGPAREPLPPLPEGVRHLPAVSAAALPGAVAPYDGLLLPYADTPYNRGVVPAKTYECLATGKPVLAAPIGGLGRFEKVFYLSPEPAQWVRLAAGLGKTETALRRRERVELARAHATSAQFEKLLDLLPPALK